jgi:hypothetical protein
MMISANTPTAAKIAPMMIPVEFVPPFVDAGGVSGVGDVRKVNWPTEARQHACVDDRKGRSSQHRQQSQTLY